MRALHDVKFSTVPNFAVFNFRIQSAHTKYTKISTIRNFLLYGNCELNKFAIITSPTIYGRAADTIHQRLKSLIII